MCRCLAEVATKEASTKRPQRASYLLFLASKQWALPVSTNYNQEHLILASKILHWMALAHRIWTPQATTPTHLVLSLTTPQTCRRRQLQATLAHRLSFRAAASSKWSKQAWFKCFSRSAKRWHSSPTKKLWSKVRPNSSTRKPKNKQLKQLARTSSSSRQTHRWLKSHDRSPRNCTWSPQNAKSWPKQLLNSNHW